MIKLQSISQQHGARVIFENLTLHIRPGERLGLVGPNGAGKSTLLRIILGAEEPKSGSVWINRSARLGYLPQEYAPFTQAGTVLSETLGAAGDVERQEARRAEIEHLLDAELDAETQAALLHEYGELLELHTHPLAVVSEFEARRVLFGLGMHEEDLSRQVAELSGGYRMRVALARLLVRPPEVLLLDEPTNHLDLHSVIWMREFLRAWNGTLLLISHDRALLNTLVTGILEVGRRTIERYKGNYDEYIEAKLVRMEIEESRRKNEDRKRREIQRFIDRFRAKATKARQAQSRVKRLARMERNARPIEKEDQRALRFRMPQPPRGGKEVLTLEELHKSYGTRKVYQGINLTLYRDQRIALVGANGAGKSTLLKVMAGVLEFEQGRRQLGYNATLAYYSQQRLEMLDAEKTIMQEMLAASRPEQSEEYLRTLLGVFLFSGDDIYKRVGVLSGGEKSRLALARLLLNPPNLLLMDEPTTHLDVAAREALEAALDQYTGTLCFISHDETFIRNLADTVIECRNGRLTVFPGEYDYYLEKTAELAAADGAGDTPADAGSANPPGGSSAAGAGKPPVAAPPPPVAASKTADGAGADASAAPAVNAPPKKSKEQLRKLRARSGQLEREMDRLGRAGTEILKQLQDPAVSANHLRCRELNLRLLQNHAELAELEREWELLLVEIET